MLKKTLVAAALALGVSGVAFANGDAAYAPMPAATPISNFNPGFYIGIQGGYADSGWDNLNQDLDLFGAVHHFDAGSHTGVGGRVFVGYDFHKNFAIEAGYTMFGSKADLHMNVDPDNVRFADVKTQAFDVVGKLKVPLDNGFGIYAKAGLGYLMSSGLHDGDLNIFTDDSFHHLGLVYGLGASYNVTPNFIIDLSWTRFSGDPSLKIKESDNCDFGLGLSEYQPNADLYAVGLAYKFDM